MMKNIGIFALNKTGLEQKSRKCIRKRYFLYTLLVLFCFLAMLVFFLWLKAPKLDMKASKSLAQQGKIVYVSTFPWDTGSVGIFLINANGTGRIQISDYQNGISDIAVSPNGEQIVFSKKDEVGESIYSIKINGTELVKLTESSWGNNQSVWSPDGKRIVFVHSYFSSDPYEYTQAIYQMDPDGSNLIKMAGDYDRIGKPIWSPDGSYIAFYADRDIYIMSPSGEGKTRLTNGDAYEEKVSWSPDSNFIAYTAKNGSNQNIHTINIDGSENVQLTYNEEGSFSPAWSPDGTRIAYTAVYSKFDPPIRFYRIDVVDLDSRETKTVLSTKPSSRPYVWQGYLYPVWSPDGDWIIGLGGDPHHTIGMCVVNVENPLLRKLIDDELDDLVKNVTWVR